MKRRALGCTVAARDSLLHADGGQAIFTSSASKGSERTHDLLVAVALLATLATLLVGTATARAYTFGPTVKQLGPEEVVFDWTTQRCDDLNVPDTPARAFKDSSGQVQLTLDNAPDNTRRMIGPSLNQLSVDCSITLTSGLNADPATYDDNEWVHSVYTPDGTKVIALVHEEYHGWDHPGQCNSQGQPNVPKRSTFPSPLEGFDPTCWYNAITVATSSDSGRTYTHATPPAQLTASVPYIYVPNTGPYGYFSPSNIVRRPDGYFYAIFFAEPYGVQQLGDCIMRAKNPASPSSWHAWDGAGYNVQFIDPYTNPDPPDTHVCAPISFTQIHRMHESITLNSFFGKYLLVGVESFYDPGTGKTTNGVWYSTSTDLVNWSQAQLVMEAELPWSYQCGDDDPILYSVVLSPGSASRNFDTTGQKTYLYFTRQHYQNCVLTNDRDLIRIPIQFLGPTPTG